MTNYNEKVYISSFNIAFPVYFLLLLMTDTYTIQLTDLIQDVEGYFKLGCEF